MVYCLSGEHMQIIASLLSTFVSLYSMAIVIRIVLSWGGIGEARFGSFYQMISRITDPYLNLFRYLPGTQRGNLDFSPLIAMVLLGIVSNILRIVAAEGRITIGLILALVTNAVWSVLSFFLFIFILLAVVRIVYEYYRSPTAIQYISILDNLLRGSQETVHRLLFGGKEITTKTLLFSTAAAFIILRMILKVIFVWGTSALASLPF
jgi:YggT family protein